MRFMDIFNKRREMVTKKNIVDSSVNVIPTGMVEQEFYKWLDQILCNPFSNNVIAINFNLYEDGNNIWSIELVGTKSFTPDDSNWACDEVMSFRDKPYTIKNTDDFKMIEDLFTSFLIKYLNNGRYANVLKQYMGIGIGFVDGDLKIIYQK